MGVQSWWLKLCQVVHYSRKRKDLRCVCECTLSMQTYRHRRQYSWCTHKYSDTCAHRQAYTHMWAHPHTCKHTHTHTLMHGQSQTLTQPCKSLIILHPIWTKAKTLHTCRQSDWLYVVCADLICTAKAGRDPPCDSVTFMRMCMHTSGSKHKYIFRHTWHAFTINNTCRFMLAILHSGIGTHILVSLKQCVHWCCLDCTFKVSFKVSFKILLG